MLTVPDDRETVAAATRRYSDALDTVVTGGLGGTPDDVTVEAVAAAFDRRMTENEVARADLKRTLEALAGDSPSPDLDADVAAQARLPAGSRPLVNHAGLSPGCVVENVYVLPGIPAEMQRMFEEVAAEFDGDRRSRTVHTAEPEADLVERLGEIQRRFDVSVGCYPDWEAGHNRLKLTADDGTALADAAAWLADNVALVDR